MDKTVTTKIKTSAVTITRADRRRFRKLMDDFINQIAEDHYRECLEGALNRMGLSDEQI